MSDDRRLAECGIPAAPKSDNPRHISTGHVKELRTGDKYRIMANGEYRRIGHYKREKR